MYDLRTYYTHRYMLSIPHPPAAISVQVPSRLSFEPEVSRTDLSRLRPNSSLGVVVDTSKYYIQPCWLPISPSLSSLARMAAACPSRMVAYSRCSAPHSLRPRPSQPSSLPPSAYHPLLSVYPALPSRLLPASSHRYSDH